MARIGKLLLVAALSGGVAYAGPAKQPTPAPAPKKPAAPKKLPLVSADVKKKLAERLSGFKFGMSKDEVIASLSKQLDDKYQPQITNTTDISQQDKLRAQKKRDLADIQSSYIEFDGHKGGWDTSVVEDEFAHHTNESMLVRWENSNGKNDRRFFFFYNGKLWKMFISLDVSILPADKRNFDTFKALLTSPDQYGTPGDADAGKLMWHADDFDVRAVDKLKIYGALGLAIEDWKVEKDVLDARAAHGTAAATTPSVITNVVDKDNKDHPDPHSNADAVDQVINANGGKK
jgi:hypothetical protein